MKKKSSTKEQQPLTFTIDYTDCYNMAVEYMELQEYQSALTLANNAYSQSPTREILLLLAEIYTKLHNYEMALNCVSAFLYQYNPTPDEVDSLLESAPKSLRATDRIFSCISFLTKFGAADRLPDVSFNVLKDEIDRLMSIDDYDENLYFSDDERIDYNQKALREATNYANNGEYQKAIDVISDMYDQETVGRENRKTLLASCYLEIGEKQKAFEIFKDLYLNDKTNSGYLADILCLGDEYKEELKDLLNQFVVTDNSTSLQRAAAVASELGDDEKAFELVNRLYYTNKGNVHYEVMRAFAMWNLGKTEEAKKYFMQVMYANRIYYPVEFFKGLRYPDRFSLDFIELPKEILKKLYDKVKRGLNDFDENIKSPEYRQAFFYVLTSPDDLFDLTSLMSELDNSESREVIPLLKKVISDLTLPKYVQKFALHLIMYKCRKGNIVMNNDGVYVQISLKTPPSYDDFSEELKHEYCYAFSILAEFDEKFGKRLTKVFEKIYLRKYFELFPKAYTLAETVTYMIIMEGAPMFLKSFCRENLMNLETVRPMAASLSKLLSIPEE